MGSIMYGQCITCHSIRDNEFHFMSSKLSVRDEGVWWMTGVDFDAALGVFTLLYILPTCGL